MDMIQYQSYDDELEARATAQEIMLDTSGGGGPITFPAPQPAPIPMLPPVVTMATSASQDNQKVLIGGLAIVLIILASVGLRSHGE
jgi:hypothetical protein